MRVCIDCKEVKEIKARNRCNRCYLILTRAERKKRYPKKECGCGCDKLMDAVTTEGKPQQFLPGHNLPKDTIGEKHPRWKGGKYKDKKDGYVNVKAYYHPFKNKNGQVGEHRLVIEKYLSKINKIKTYIHPSLDVDHKNGITDDNRIENLRIMEKSDHGRMHSIERWKKEKKPRVS